MVYLCVQAWLWYDKAVKKVYNGKMSEYLHQNHKKKKNICYPNVPLKEKQKKKKKGLHQNELFNAKLFTIHPGGGHLLNPKN